MAYIGLGTGNTISVDYEWTPMNRYGSPRKWKPHPAWWIAFRRIYRRPGLLGHPPWWWVAVKHVLGC